MGADIHMYLQRRKNPKAKWELHPGHVEGEYGLEELTGGDRWYSFFGHLAGVRGGGRPIAGHKGLPKDCPQELIDQSTSEHSHSYCTLIQLETAIKRAMKENASDDWGSFEEELAKSDNTEIFFDWRTYPSESPGYLSIIRYCRKWIWETKVESGLAGINSDLNKPQVRFIYYFDS